MATSQDLRDELGLVSSLIEELPELVLDKLVDTYKKDITDSVQLQEGDYRLTPDDNIFEVFRQRTTRTYQVDLADVIESDDLPKEVKRGGIRFDLTIAIHEGCGEYIDYKAGKYGFEQVCGSIGEPDKSAQFFQWAGSAASLIYHVLPSQTSSEIKRQEKRRKAQLCKGLQTSKEKLRGANNPFDKLAYRVCNYLLRKYAD